MEGVNKIDKPSKTDKGEKKEKQFSFSFLWMKREMYLQMQWRLRRSGINTINNLCEQVENTIKSIFRSFHSLKESMPRGYCNWALLKLEMSDNPYIEKEKKSPQSLFEVSKALKIKWDRLWINLIYEKY